MNYSVPLRSSNLFEDGGFKMREEKSCSDRVGCKRNANNQKARRGVLPCGFGYLTFVEVLRYPGYLEF